MFSFLQREVVSRGGVLFRGSIPQRLEQLSLGPDITVAPAAATESQLWSARANHPKWGEAHIMCFRAPQPLPDELIDCTLSLSDAEKTLARTGEHCIGVEVSARKGRVLADGKRLLFWLRAVMGSAGAVAFNAPSMLLWSSAMLDDELAHEADLDIESLYCLHAVHRDNSPDVFWLHTHGLEQLNAFDIDVLQPSPMAMSISGDIVRALAFAALEGAIQADASEVPLAWPGGTVSLVPVERFHAQAAERYTSLRELDTHGGRRSVVCEPATGFFSRWRRRPVPSRFLTGLNDDQVVFHFTAAATALMSERARRTVPLFAAMVLEFEELELPALVKLGYETDGGSDSDREHLWFQVHRVVGDKVDATLTNAPHRVSALTQGQRGEFDLSRLTDWSILSPAGMMTPRNISAARQLRNHLPIWKERLNAMRNTAAGSE